MAKKENSTRFWRRILCVSLVLCLVSMIAVSLIQTSGHKITIKNMAWETPSGHLISADLWVPGTATKDSPAPGVVTVEGWYNNKEMQDLYNVELARRGYVVLTMDLHSHGNSESLPLEELYDGAVGVDGAVQLLASLPYVDASRIGVTGHSSGGTAANMAVELDNAREVPLIACVLQQAGDWQDDTGGDHSGDYGSRSVGIIASEYDDFYFGTYDETGSVMLTTPKEFMTTEGAQRFLNFNEDVSTFQGPAEAGKYYTKDFDGKEAVRVIYRPTCIHPAVVFNGGCVANAIDFFERTLGAPDPLPSGSQVWQMKTAFNTVGLIGLFLFIVSLTIVMLDTQYFGVLKAKEEPQPARVADQAGRLWFWGCLLVSAVFSGVSYMFCIEKVYSHTTTVFPQTGPLTIGAWAASCGIFAILLMVLSYQLYGKKHGVSLKEIGLAISPSALLKTVLLAVIVVVCTFGVVFFAQYFFQADFRIWTLAFKTFQADKVLIALRYLPFFLIYYVANSVSVNCFNFNQYGGKYGNSILLGLSASLAPIILVAAQYICFYSTGRQLLGLSEGERIAPIWLIPTIVILFLAVLLARAVYKKTRNPYLAGLISAMLVTMINCSNTTTILSAGTMIATTF